MPESSDCCLKAGSNLEQSSHPVFFREAKTPIERTYLLACRETHSCRQDDPANQSPSTDHSVQTPSWTLFRAACPHATPVSVRETHSYRQDDPIQLLDRHQRTTVFIDSELDTVKCDVHTCNIWIRCHTPNSASVVQQAHRPQSCPLHAEARPQHWPIWSTLADKLWGSKEALTTTTNFNNGTGLRI